MAAVVSESVEALAGKVRACEVPGLCVQCLARLRAAFVTHYQTTGLGPSYVEREANAALDALLARLAEAEKERDRSKDAYQVELRRAGRYKAERDEAKGRSAQYYKRADRFWVALKRIEKNTHAEPRAAAIAADALRAEQPQGNVDAENAALDPEQQR